VQVNIVLEAQRVEYRPTMINLTHVVNIVAKELISIVAIIPRLRDVMMQPDPIGPSLPNPFGILNGQEAPVVNDAPVLGLAAEVVAAQERQVGKGREGQGRGREGKRRGEGRQGGREWKRRKGVGD
jgi:hypothetical protein